MNQSDPIMVSVWMIAYNHEGFIKQAIDSILMQKTNFKFEIVIGEDCSTDKTADIIREYQKKHPDIIKARFNAPNLGMSANTLKSFSECTGKYIAMCEGDDYWTNENKLQIQYDFLENNPQYGLVAHRYDIVKAGIDDIFPDYGNRLFDDNIHGIDIDLTMFFNVWLTKTMTVMFRKELLDITLLQKYKHFRDTHLFYHLIKQKNGYCLNMNMAVYNVHPGGVHSTKSNILDRCSITEKIINEIYTENKDCIYVLEHYKEMINWYKNELMNIHCHDVFFFYKPYYYRHLCNYVKITSESIIYLTSIYHNFYNLAKRAFTKTYRIFTSKITF